MEVLKYLNPNHTMLVTVPRIAAVFFTALQLLGMKFYPGGTMYDASTQGYSFSKNFSQIWVPTPQEMETQTTSP